MKVQGAASLEIVEGFLYIQHNLFQCIRNVHFLEGAWIKFDIQRSKNAKVITSVYNQYDLSDLLRGTACYNQH